MGALILLGFGKTSAQDTNHVDRDTIQVTTTYIPKDQSHIKTQDIAQMIINSNNDMGVFLDSIVGRYPFVQVIDIDLQENPEYLYRIPGAYFPRQDSVVIYKCFINNPGASVSLMNETYGPERIATELKKRNDNLPYLVTHELGHYLDRHSYSHTGMTLSQVLQIEIHAEISKRIRELLLRRANKSNEVQKIMQEVQNISASRRIKREEVIRMVQQRAMPGGNSSVAKEVRSSIGEYGKYLYDDSISVSDTIPHDEIDCIVSSAIIMLKEHISQYQNDIPKLFMYDLRRSRQAKYKEENITLATGFDRAIHLLYTIDDIDFINLCSPEVQKQLLQTVKQVTKNMQKRSDISQIFKDWGHLDDIANNFAVGAGFSTYSALDISTNKNLNNSNLNQERSR